jgi:hypothetical protein
MTMLLTKEIVEYSLMRIGLHPVLGHLRVQYVTKKTQRKLIIYEKQDTIFKDGIYLKLQMPSQFLKAAH